MSTLTAKDRIMSALFNSTDCNITTEDILWVSTYIPDNKDGEGTYKGSNPLLSINYDHKNRSVYEAIEIDEDKIDEYKKIIVNTFADNDCFSKAVEQIIAKNDQEMIKYALVEGLLAMRVRYAKDDAADQLRALFRLLKRGKDDLSSLLSESDFDLSKVDKVISIGSLEDLNKAVNDPNIPEEVRKKLLAIYWKLKSGGKDSGN